MASARLIRPRIGSSLSGKSCLYPPPWCPLTHPLCSPWSASLPPFLCPPQGSMPAKHGKRGPSLPGQCGGRVWLVVSTPAHLPPGLVLTYLSGHLLQHSAGTSDLPKGVTGLHPESILFSWYPFRRHDTSYTPFWKNECLAIASKIPVSRNAGHTNSTGANKGSLNCSELNKEYAASPHFILFKDFFHYKVDEKKKKSIPGQAIVCMEPRKLTCLILEGLWVLCKSLVLCL